MAQIMPLSEELQKIAIDELGEVPSRIPEDLQALRMWIDQQPHLNARTDDRFLLQFLRGCKFSLEKAKEKIDKYHALKSKFPELCSVTDVDDIKLRETFNVKSIVFLPTPLNETGPRIFFYRFNYSTSKIRIEDILKCFSGLNDILMDSDPYACIQGVIYIVDLADLSASHIMQYTPTILKRTLSYYEKTMPLRIKKVIYLNANSIAEAFFKVLFPMFSEKLRSRVFVTGKNMSGLEEHIPLKYLPIEYGGSNGSLDQIVKDYNKVWDEYREYFKRNANYGTDERLRIGKPIDFESDFGTGGSFRKIAVD